MRISDWSSDVCSSDLAALPPVFPAFGPIARDLIQLHRRLRRGRCPGHYPGHLSNMAAPYPCRPAEAACRSEEHTSELQSLMRISYAVFCLKKKNIYTYLINPTITMRRHKPKKA